MGASVSGLNDGKGDSKNGQSSVSCHRRHHESGEGRIKSASSTLHGDQLVGGPVREKKKKMTGFATLRRKLIRRRRTSKSFDHGKVMREFLSDWSPLELSALVEEYEATAALKDLSVQADLARPPASTYKQDISDLFDYKYASDVTLIFQGACFPAHRAVLSSRCAYFRELLASSCGTLGRGAAVNQQQQVHVDSLLQSRGIDVPTFAALLRYLYTGDFSLERSPGELGGGSVEHLEMLLMRLGQEFGTPNALEHDLRHLMETAELADAVLVFASSQDFPSNLTKATAGSSGSTTSSLGSTSSHSDYGFFPWLEIPCHRAVLSARSPFFRSLIQRRCRTNPETGAVQAVSSPIRIVLDESVIPRRYARVLMQALYLDTVDMNCIIRSGYNNNSNQSTSQQAASGEEGACASSSGAAAASSDSTPCTSSGEATACAGGSTVPAAVQPRPAPPSLFEEATELYQIGRFLELDILAQGCEDVIVDNLCLDNLPQVLRWSELPHGSPWVRRQALHLLREEFASVAQAGVLLELDKSHLIEALQSDFLQASELEVLQCVLRWGEHQLVRRMEDREPNIVSQTTHSVARKGVRRRDLNDVELRDILSDLLPHVRVDHILPPNHEALAQAIRRGLVSSPPSHMIGGDVAAHCKQQGYNGQLRMHAWIRGGGSGGGCSGSGGSNDKSHGGLYVKPRLFMPYLEEAKTLLADQLVQEMELVRLRMVRISSHIPDTLYMIDDAHQHHGQVYGTHQAYCYMQSGVTRPGSPAGLMLSSSATADLDVVTGAVPVPDSETLQAMIRRERKLRQSPLAQRAYSLPLASRRDIHRQIRLRVVREFNLPDSIAQELEAAAYQFAEEEADESHQAQQQQQQQQQATVWQHRKSSAPMPVRMPVPPKKIVSSGRPRSVQQYSKMDDEDGLDQQHNNSQLSEFIPDIAALSLHPQQLAMPHFIPPIQPPEPYRELQLDLGDGSAASLPIMTAPRTGHEWPIVRGPPSGFPPPVRMSTFRNQSADDDWAAAAAAAESAASATLSPRSQRRTRSSRAAAATDVRVFI